MSHLESLTTARLYTLFHDLEEARAALGAERKELSSRRQDALQRAVEANDEGLRPLLARQIVLLERRDRLLAAQQALADKQMRLVERLVYAREEQALARHLEEAVAGRGLDWLDALVWAEGLRRGGARRARAVGELLAWVEEMWTPMPEPVAGLRTEWATVARVPDGDGAVLDDGRRVRYLGIDAPEMGRPHPEPYAREARDLNAGLVAGQRVRLERDLSDTDVHGRLLRYVWRGEQLVNAELVKRGAAFAFPVPLDTRFKILLARLERQARRARRGLWAEGWE